MRAFVSDEVGRVKAVGLGAPWAAGAKGRGQVLGAGAGGSGSGREHGVCSMEWAMPSDWRRGIVWASLDGSLTHLRSVQEPREALEDGAVLTWGAEARESVDLLDKAKGKPVGIAVFEEEQKLCVCQADGALSTVRFDPSAPLGKAFGDAEILSSLEVGPDVARMRRSPVTGLVATGGKENDLCLWDVEKGVASFRAKNVAHDFLDMRVPVWVTDMCFLGAEPRERGPTKSLSGGAPERVVTCSGYSHVRVYDTRVQRRPVLSEEFMDERGNSKESATSRHLTCIAAVSDHEVVAGSAVGDLFRVDLRTMKISARYKGFAGSVRALYKHPEEPLLVSASIDRHVRLHDIDAHKLLHSVYVKQRLTGCLLAPAPAADVAATAKAEAIVQKQAQAAEDVVEPLALSEGEDSDEEEKEEETKSAGKKKGKSKPKPKNSKNAPAAKGRAKRDAPGEAKAAPSKRRR